MGKWTDLLRTLKKLPDGERDGGETYQEKVRARAAEIKSRKLSEVARAYKSLRFKEEQHEEQAKAIRLDLRAHELLLEAGFEGEGLTKVAFEEGGNLAYEPQPHTIVSDPEAFREWCVKTPDVASRMTLQWATTNSLAKQLLEGGKKLPPGLDMFAKPKFVLRDS